MGDEGHEGGKSTVLPALAELPGGNDCGVFIGVAAGELAAG
jgi:hypothetical protein